jgi:hypothetical protein
VGVRFLVGVQLACHTHIHLIHRTHSGWTPAYRFAGTFLGRLGSTSPCWQRRTTLQQEHASSEWRLQCSNRKAWLHSRAARHRMHGCFAKHSHCGCNICLHCERCCARLSSWKHDFPYDATLTACALLLPLTLLPLLLLPLQPPGQCHCWQLCCPPVSQPWHDGAHPLHNGQVTLN